MPGPGWSAVAAGAIPVGAGVKHTTNRGEVAVGGNNDYCPFIAQPMTRDTPGLPGSAAGAAVAQGDPIALYRAGDIGWGVLGGTVAKGDQLKWNGTGFVSIATTGTTAQMITGQALEPGDSGGFILIHVHPLYKVYPALA